MSLLVEYIREFGQFQRNARLYLMSTALSGITIGMILVLYNLYLVSLGYDTDFIGLILFMGTLGAGTAIFPAGVCVDRFGGKAILIWASALIGVAGAGQFLLRTPLPLLISSFVAGIGAACILVVNSPFLTAHSSPTERSLLFSFNIVLSLATTVLGEILGGVLPVWFRSLPWLMSRLPGWLAEVLAPSVETRSYQLALLAAGLIAAPSFIPLFLMRTDRPLTNKASETPTSHWRISRSVLTGLFLEPGRFKKGMHHPITVLVAVQACVGLGAGFFIPYFNIYFVRHLGISSALFGLIDGGANTMNALLTLLAPLLVMRLGKVNTITITRLCSIPLLLLMGLTNFWPLIAVLYLFRQSTMDMAAGILQVFSMETVPQQHRGLSNSSFQTAFQIAWALAAPLGGIIIAHSGFTAVFIIGAVFYVVAIVLFWSRFRHSEQAETLQEEKEQEKTSAAHSLR